MGKTFGKAFSDYHNEIRKKEAEFVECDKVCQNTRFYVENMKI